MSNPTSNAPNRSLNEIMNDTDVGSLIVKNKNPMLFAFAIVLTIIIVFAMYSSYADKVKTESNLKIYDFESTVLKNWGEKSSPTGLVEAIKHLNKSVGNYAGLIPVVIKASDLLIDQNHLNEALEILNIGQNVSKNDYANYFILSRLAVTYEDLGQDQKAIETLNKMNNQSVKIFEGKNYLDLGRLYLKTGDKEKAKASFTYVTEKAKDEIEFVKIAKLYLSKL